MKSGFFGKLATLALVSMGLCLVAGFDDSALAAFSNASLDGRYAGTIQGRGGQGREYVIGVIDFDGAGHFTNHFFGDTPGHPFPTRLTGEFNNKGTYSVGADGRGTLMGTNNPAEPNPTHFVIAATQGGKATRVCFIIDDLSVGIGSLRSGCVNRVTAEAVEKTFDKTSLNGTYGGLLITEGGRAPISVVGLLTFDGNGNFTTNLDANVPVPLAFPDRITEHLTTAGTYTVNADGTCSMKGNNAAEPDPTFCVISGQLAESGKATQIDICFVNEGSPAGGLSCGTATIQ